jgi:DNA-binding response OmpR family regulator
MCCYYGADHEVISLGQRARGLQLEDRSGYNKFTMISFTGKHLRILIIEDEPTIVEFLRVGLTYEHFEIEIAEDGLTGLSLARQSQFDLVILDLMLPGMDGFEVCRQLRLSGNNVSIIMLTARKEVPDRVTGLNLGADDYITKPFSFDELLARIQAVLRRRGQAMKPEVLRTLDLMLNPETHEVYHHNEPLDLTPIEFTLLELFLSNPRRVFTRDTLLNRVWGYDYTGDTNVVDVHIGHLRDKIGDNEHHLIRTVYGVGYSFRPDDVEALA